MDLESANLHSNSTASGAKSARNSDVWMDSCGRRWSNAVPGVYPDNFWCVGATRKGSICALDEAAARALFKELAGEDAVKCDRLPYGASPALNVIVYPGGFLSTQANVCFDPDHCIGHLSCPKRRTCSE